MATFSDDSDENDFIVIGTAVPELSDDQPLQKPTTVQDQTATDKQGRRRFHGAFTGGFSAGYFNTVGSKEGFTPSTFISSRQKKSENADKILNTPEDFMDEEDLEEHGIAPRKFATAVGYTSEERKRKLQDDVKQIASASGLDMTPALVDFIVPEQIPIGIQLLCKMGWREGQGLGPRKRKKRKKQSSKPTNPSIKMYGCALPPPSDDDQSDSDEFVPQNLENIKFAPKDVCPISLEVKNDVHGLGYHGIDSSLALPRSHIHLFPPPLRSSGSRKGIQGLAFGVGVFEGEDENIYATDSLSNYHTTMRLDDEEDNTFGWTAPRQHGQQTLPVTYVGKLLEGFCLSSKPLQPRKKYPPPTLPQNFKPQHWFRKKRVLSHLPDNLKNDDDLQAPKKLTAVDRGLLLGETPIMKSVFDLVQKEDMNRIEATKAAIAMSQTLKDKAKNELSSRFQTVETHDNPPAKVTSQVEAHVETLPSTFLSKFKPAESVATESEVKGPASNVPLFQGGLNFQPFRKDPAKQERYDKYLALVKQGVKDPYATIASSHMTGWEKSREKEEFAKAAKIFRPMSAMMSARFVRGAMIDDEQMQGPSNSSRNEVNDQTKAAEMGMFGQLTHEVFEWHPHSLLCKRFNVPNPYPGSDVIGVPSIKRDKFSVFNFLNFNDYQPPDAIEEKVPEPESVEKTLKPNRKTTMASVFKVLDDPNFNAPTPTPVTGDSKGLTDINMSEPENSIEDEESKPPDMDLFRAIFKNSDSEDSSDDDKDESKKDSSGEDERRESKTLTEQNDSDLEIDTKDIQAQAVQSVEKLKETYTNSAPESGSKSLSWKRKKSRFSDLTETNENDKIDQIIADVAEKEDALSRLTAPREILHQESDDEYGPKLPSFLDPPSSRLYTDGVESMIEVKHSEEKQGDKKKDRHKHRKEKKKKSKHKKNKKHKKHKKSKLKKVKKSETRSGDEADTESESDDSSDSDI
ncbi:G patch domain-containing protein 1-like isoform X2 [Biomphalaria glabrata]|uniref:G patch domain-containing protein 1-like isoform X2 n=1 Tax=Biomphalaria glabrata TaxID=6526 RepID=A0A9U8E6X9_BIOGL|nr:G patch domain-containing protein 1-like isoform X2 [Biomphalaria glabrata]